MKLVKSIVLSMALLAAIIAASPVFATGRSFHAFLGGFEEVPSVLTNGSGFFHATVNRDGSISYFLKVRDLSSTFAQAHIHFGQKDVNGGVMVFLCGGPSVPCAEEVRGTLSAASVVGAATAQGVATGDIDAVIETLRSGNTYVNVHTANFPAGEIRGQVKK
jgi:hypothetical protein